MLTTAEKIKVIMKRNNFKISSVKELNDECVLIINCIINYIKYIIYIVSSIFYWIYSVVNVIY